MKTKTTDELLLDKFYELDKNQDFPVKDIQQKVAFISTPRCGSSMFCDILKGTGKVGLPQEWINMRYISAYAKYRGTSNINMEEYLNFIFRKTTSSNGVFSINFHIEQHADMLKHNFDVFTLNFNHAYYLFREEKIDQAFSLAKASLTDQWSSTTKAVNEVKGEIGRERILQSLMHISQSEQYYNDNLKGRITKEYAYEDFSSLTTTNVFNEIMTDLKITDVERSWATSMEKQQNKTDIVELTKLKNYLSRSANW